MRVGTTLSDLKPEYRRIVVVGAGVVGSTGPPKFRQLSPGWGPRSCEVAGQALTDRGNGEAIYLEKH